jgi:hypothetical protein
MGARALTYGSVFAALVFVLGCGQGGGGGGGDGGGSVMDGSVVPDSGEDFPCVPSSLNVEFPANGCDDDGDGMTDEAPESCDGDVAADGDANAFARAIGLCQAADDTHWGLVSAVFTRSHTEELPTDDLKHSILTKYGAVLTPREGTKLGVLGTAAAEESADEPFFTQDNLLAPAKANPEACPCRARWATRGAARPWSPTTTSSQSSSPSRHRPTRAASARTSRSTPPSGRSSSAPSSMTASSSLSKANQARATSRLIARTTWWM